MSAGHKLPDVEACGRERLERILASGRPARVAVIGTGIAGETALYFLSQPEMATRVELVRVYESRPRPGLHDNSIEIDGHRVDVPLRAVSPHYYANLSALYRHLGVELQPVDYSSSTTRYPANPSVRRHDEQHQPSECDRQGDFCYRNFLLMGLALPFFMWRDLLSLSRIVRLYKMLRDLFFMVLTGPHVLRRWQAKSRGVRSASLGEYVRQHGYSYEFVQEFLYPMLSTLLSCSYAQVDQYPAEYIIQFFCSRKTTLLTGWYRVRNGVEDVSDRLLRHVKKGCITYNSPVASVRFDKARDIVEVVDAKGVRCEYDAVIIATEPWAAAKMWTERTDAEDLLMRSLQHYEANMTVHTDAKLMPQCKSSWRGMNVFYAPSSSPKEASMTSARLSQYHAALVSPRRRAPSPGAVTENVEYFETWNRFEVPDPQSIVCDVTMTRAVWDVAAKEAYDAHFRECQGRRGVFLIGSYTEPGVTLLEQAVTSGCRVAQQFGCSLPFSVRPCYDQSGVMVLLSSLLYFAWSSVQVLLKLILLR